MDLCLLDGNQGGEQDDGGFDAISNMFAMHSEYLVEIWSFDMVYLWHCLKHISVSILRHFLHVLLLQLGCT